MTHEVAGLTLTAPRLLYEAEDPAWGVASLSRPHLARTLEGATLALRLAAGPPVATFELKPFLQPAVQPYSPPPAAAWRALLVEQTLLARPELVWTGAFPKGWDTDLPAPWAAALVEALAELHRRYRGLCEVQWSDYTLRTLECAECRAVRAAALPPDLSPWQLQMRMSSSSRCPHGNDALRGVGMLCRAHPELTFELLGWIEPAGARAEAEGPPVTRFALTGPVMQVVLGPWLVGEEQRLAPKTSFRGYTGSRMFHRSWDPAPDPRHPVLPRWQHGAVALAASAWGFTGEPDALVLGDAAGGPPGLDRAAAPPIETPAALPGDRVRGKAARARRARRER